MRLPWVLWFAAWAWAWRGLPWVVWAEEATVTHANDCERYEPQGPALTGSPVMQFQRRVTVSLVPLNEKVAVTIVIKSSVPGKECTIIFISEALSIQCEKGRHTLRGISNMFGAGEVTDLWLEMAPGLRNNTPSTWDLRLVGRKGRHRVHLLEKDTKLQPPFTLTWVMNMHMQYYFNCITGCLFLKSVELPAGDYTFFLRHDEDFTQMTLDCSSISDDFEDYQKKFSINVTKDVLGSPGGLKAITAVWLPELGRVGILVDGTPEGGKQHQPLSKERRVNVTVDGGGGGLVAACDPRFQAVAGKDSEEASSEPSTATSPPTTTTTTDPSPAAISDTHQDEHHQDHDADHWLPATFTLVLLNLIITLGAVILAAFFYFRSSNKTPQFPKEPSVLGTFVRQLSNRSSTRSQHRGSTRRNKDQTEKRLSGQQKVGIDPAGETEAALEGGDQKQKVLSTDSLVKMELI